MLDWFYDDAPFWLVALVVILLLLGAAGLGQLVRRKRPIERNDEEKGGQALIMSAVLGLLALLLGFTFALAIDRYDARRGLVLEEANNIGTTWLRAQLLDEPGRTRLSQLLEAYTANRIELANAEDFEQRMALLRRSERYHEQLWAATVEAIRPIRDLEIAPTFVESMNATIDIAAARKAARRAHVPPRVLSALLAYMVVTAFAVGYALLGFRIKLAAGVLLLLLTLSYLLILDIDQPIAAASASRSRRWRICWRACAPARRRPSDDLAACDDLRNWPSVGPDPAGIRGIQNPGFARLFGPPPACKLPGRNKSGNEAIKAWQDHSDAPQGLADKSGMWLSFSGFPPTAR